MWVRPPLPAPDSRTRSLGVRQFGQRSAHPQWHRWVGLSPSPQGHHTEPEALKTAPVITITKPRSREEKSLDRSCTRGDSLSPGTATDHVRQPQRHGDTEDARRFLGDSLHLRDSHSPRHPARPSKDGGAASPTRRCATLGGDADGAGIHCLVFCRIDRCGVGRTASR